MPNQEQPGWIDLPPVPQAELLVLVHRANAAAKALSQFCYCGETQWIGEVRVKLIHGANEFELTVSPNASGERVELEVQICSFMHFRRPTLEEAELVVKARGGGE